MAPSWEPEPTNRVVCAGFVAMVGGPTAGHLPQHAHAELQLTVHFGRRPKVQLIEPCEPHTGRWSRGVRVAVMLLAPSLIDEATDDLVVRGQARFHSSTHARDPLVQALANAVITDLETPSRPTRRLYFESIGYTLAGHLVRRYTNVPIRRPDRLELTVNQLDRVHEFVATSLDRTVSVRDLAAAAGVSPRLFADAFKRTTGTTPYRYVVRRRLDAAGRLLLMTRLPIAEIALRLGFANQSHFTAAFSRVVGVTPAKYRLGSG